MTLSCPIRKRYLTRFLPDLLVIACCMLSLSLSIIESRLNTDPHHWGLMYANAADLNRGLIPYKEIFIQYGFLTTLIQSLSLKILGNSVVSIGIITGVFYALSIYLSYLLWQKILDRWLSSLSAMLMFLIHPYIIYPWADYFSYTFLLLSLFFLTRSPQTANRYFIAGLFLACGFLTRQTGPLLALIPIYLYFLIRYFASDKLSQDSQRKNIGIFHLGILGVVVVFLLFIFRNSALRDWIIQTFKPILYYTRLYSLGISRFSYNLITATSFVGRDLRVLLYSFAFFNNLVISGIVFLKSLRNQASQRQQFFFLFAAVALSGYLQSVHIYELFRLQNSVSLGIGLLVFSLYQTANLFKKWKRLAFTIPIICLVVYLTQTLLFTKTSSVYNPWNKDLLFSRQLGAPKDIDMLKGKLYDIDMRTYYENIASTLNNYSGQFKYLVNLTIDCYIPLLSTQYNYKRAQRAPFYKSQGLTQMVFQDEEGEIARLLTEKQTVLITKNPKQIPKDYCVVLNLKDPTHLEGMTYVAVPK